MLAVMIARYFAFAALLRVALAQTTSYTTATITEAATYSTDTASSTSQPITETVSVGLGGHVFQPDVVQISPGNYVGMIMLRGIAI